MESKPDIRNMTAEEVRRHYKQIRLAENETSEEEKRLLQTMFVFPDGEKSDLITISKRRGRWVYICHVCDLKPKHWNIFIQHLEGRSHQEMLKKPPVTRERFGVRFYYRIDRDEIALIPGIVEDKNTIFSKANCKYDKPLIGVEYIVELVQKQPVLNWISASKTAKYVCLLCDEEGNLESIRHHISTPDHCWTYLDRFFPKAAKKIESSNYSHDVKDKLMKHVVAKVEYEYGRLQGSQILEHAFPNMRNVIFEKIEKDPHLRELFTRDYTACVDIRHLNNSVCPVGWLRRKSETHQKGKHHYLPPPPLDDLPPLKRRKTTVEKSGELDIAKKDTGKRFGSTDLYSTSRQSENKCQKEVDSGNPNKQSLMDNHSTSYTSDRRFHRFKKEEPYEKNPARSFHGPCYSSYQRDQNSFPNQSYKSSIQDGTKAKVQNISHNEKKIGIIPVLRTLSILETELGSLGKKVIELLQEALHLERISTGGSDILITHEEILLETIKQKLIGLLDLQMVNQTLVGITNKAIKQIESLLSDHVNRDVFQGKNSCSDNIQSSTIKSGQKYVSSKMSEQTYASTEISERKTNPIFTNQTETSYHFNNSQRSNFYSQRGDNCNSSEYRDNFSTYSNWSKQERNMGSSRSYSTTSGESVREANANFRSYRLTNHVPVASFGGMGVDVQLSTTEAGDVKEELRTLSLKRKRMSGAAKRRLRIEYALATGEPILPRRKHSNRNYRQTS